MNAASRRLNALALSTLVAAVALCAGAPAAQARTFTQAGSIEASLEMGGYFFANEAENLKHTFDYHLSGTYNFTSLLGAELAMDFSPREVNRVTFFHLHLDVIVHPFRSEWFVPFVGAGPTFSVAFPEVGDTDSDPGVNIVVGTKIMPWDHVGFRADLRYIARIGTDSGEETGHDFLASFGLLVSFGGEDAVDEDVLLDTDGDGFLDDVDKCPLVPGVASAEGCPDKDEDTVTDPDDACPETPGLVELAGCPDGDGDKIIDKDDRCPAEPGAIEMKGCPDSDGDAIADPDDRCPNIAGTAEYEGCPPPPPVEVVERFNGTIAGVSFEFDSDAIRPESYPVLDEAARVLNEYPALILMVEGHTSAEGLRDYNIDLSTRRAASVCRYLIEKGVGEERLESVGYGPDRPVAGNDSEQERALNRRIEFKILRQ